MDKNSDILRNKIQLLLKKNKIDVAIDTLDEELHLNPENWEAYNFKGFCYLKIKNYSDAFLNFEAAINIDDSQSESWGFLGTYYLIIKNTKLAKECFERVKLLESTELSNSQIAYYYYTVNDYKNATLYVDKTLSMNAKNESALNTKGLLLIKNNDYKSSIEIFRKLISLNRHNSMYYNNLGHALQLDNKLYYAQKNLEKSIKLDSSNAYAYNNLALLHNLKSNIKKAWEYICTATILDQDNPQFWLNKGELLFIMIKSGEETDENLEDVGYYYHRGNISTVDALSALNYSNISKNDIDEIVQGMINMDLYFSESTKNCVADINFYYSVYKISLEIIALLNASEDEEFYFSHYTTEETSNTLIFNNSFFRLNSVTTANDPKEGYPLLNFLGFTGLYSPNIYQAFIGSFTFSSDSLNQFRLYGKKENIEGSGIGLELSYKYFAENIAINNSLISPNNDISDTKQSIFRCVYLDPISRRVISLGHKEPCVFYRENINEDRKIVDEKVKKYLGEIEIIKNQVETLLIELYNIIQEYHNKVNDLAKKNEIIKIVPSLLIHLRYLIKHYDFKEEQECRIIQVEPLIDNPKIKTSMDFSRMYIDYLPFRVDTECFLKNIYFGPKTTNFELFKDRITQLNSNILCWKNEHPFN